jgi:hypothetical protein
VDLSYRRRTDGEDGANGDQASVMLLCGDVVSLMPLNQTRAARVSPV